MLFLHGTKTLPVCHFSFAISQQPFIFSISERRICFAEVFLSQSHSPAMPGALIGPQTLYDKVLRDHIVDEKEDGSLLLYIGKSRVVSPGEYQLISMCADRHLVHEVTSPVSFNIGFYVTDAADSNCRVASFRRLNECFAKGQASFLHLGYHRSCECPCTIDGILHSSN